MTTSDKIRSMLFYAEDTGVFTWRVDRQGGTKAGDIAGQLNPNGRVYIGAIGRRFLRSHLAWCYVHGRIPTHEIDHIDGNPANDAIANLRHVSHKTNAQNRVRANRRVSGRSSTYLGVSWKTDRQKWVANISSDSHTKHLGYFESEQDAHAAYVQAKQLVMQLAIDSVASGALPMKPLGGGWTGTPVRSALR